MYYLYLVSPTPNYVITFDGRVERASIRILWWWLDVIVIHQDCAGKFALTVVGFEPATSESLVRGINHSAT